MFFLYANFQRSQKQVLYKTINVFFCKENPETLLHLFFHCPITVAFWNDFRVWWLRNTQIEFNLTPANVLYGVIDNSKFCTLLNFALLVAKFTYIVAVYTRHPFSSLSLKQNYTKKLTSNMILPRKKVI